MKRKDRVLQAAVFLVLILALSLPAWCKNQVHRAPPTDDTFDIVTTIIFGLVLIMPSALLLLWWPIDTLIHWRSRWDRLRSNPQCTRYSSNTACRTAISVCVVILCAAAAYYLAVHKELTAESWHGYYSDLKIYCFLLPIQWVIVLFFADATILCLLSYLTLHICITDDGVICESVVRSGNTDGISWDRLTWVEVKESSRNVSGILKVVLHGKKGKRESRCIAIPGHHPAVKQMLDAIRQYAPDKFEPPPKKVTVVPPRVKFIRALAMAYMVIITVAMLYANWLIQHHPKSIAAMHIWIVSMWVMIMVGCLQWISEFVFTYTAYKRHSSPLDAHEYALADDRSYKSRSYAVFAVVVVISIAISLYLVQGCILQPKSTLVMFPIVLGSFLMPIMMGAQWLITKLSARVCITDDGICVRTARTSEDREGINWKHLTGVDVQTSHQSPSGIRRVVVRGGVDKWSKSSITIPGSHPDIQRILQDIREHAPNTVSKTFFGQ